MAKNYENENKAKNYSTDKTSDKNAMDSRNSSKNSSKNASRNSYGNKTSNAYDKEQNDYSVRYYGRIKQDIPSSCKEAGYVPASFAACR